MNRLRLMLIVSFILLLGLPLAAQTPSDEIAQLKARVKALEAENEELKQAIGNRGVGSLGVPYGRLVTIEGEYDPKTPSRSIFSFRVKSVNGQNHPGDVHLYLRTLELASSKATRVTASEPLKLKGFQCTGWVGSPVTGLALQLVEVFIIIEVLDQK